MGPYFASFQSLFFAGATGNFKNLYDNVVWVLYYEPVKNQGNDMGG